MLQKLQLSHVYHPGAHDDRPRRRRTCLNGTLVHGSGAFSVNCAIGNISEGGAKVLLTNRQPLPSDLYLIVVKYCVAYEAKVVWLKFPARGLQFSKTYLLDSSIPKEIDFLRQLWIDLCERSGGIDSFE